MVNLKPFTATLCLCSSRYGHPTGATLHLTLPVMLTAMHQARSDSTTNLLWGVPAPQTLHTDTRPLFQGELEALPHTPSPGQPEQSIPSSQGPGGNRTGLCQAQHPTPTHPLTSVLAVCCPSVNVAWVPMTIKYVSWVKTESYCPRRMVQLLFYTLQSSFCLNAFVKWAFLLQPFHRIKKGVRGELRFRGTTISEDWTRLVFCGSLSTLCPPRTPAPTILDASGSSFTRASVLPINSPAGAWHSPLTYKAKGSVDMGHHSPASMIHSAGKWAQEAWVPVTPALPRPGVLSSALGGQVQPVDWHLC